MDEIPRESVDRLMVACARRCCICRRFRPTKLQVHHIVPRSEGGTSEEDNLIVTCLTCHMDVHSQVPFARRFSPDELKGHRDALMQMVADGRFPGGEADETDQFTAKPFSEVPVCPRNVHADALSVEAVELLLAAAHAAGNRQGTIVLSDTNAGLRIFPGGRQCPYDASDRRATARYKAAIAELLSKGLMEYSSDSLREVTDLGYVVADEIASGRAQHLDRP